MQPITYEDITLRDFTENDIENKIRWINHPENNRFLHYHLPLEYDKTLLWFQTKKNKERMDCVIEYRSVPVGLIGLLNIDHTSKKAEFYISMGQTEYKQKGIATKACRALIQYAFTELNLHKLYLNTDGENFIAHRLFEKVGFVREGVFREDMWHRGVYIDRIRYGLINTNSGEKK